MKDLKPFHETIVLRMYSLIGEFFLLTGVGVNIFDSLNTLYEKNRVLFNLLEGTIIPDNEISKLQEALKIVLQDFLKQCHQVHPIIKKNNITTSKIEKLFREMENDLNKRKVLVKC